MNEGHLGKVQSGWECLNKCTCKHESMKMSNWCGSVKHRSEREGDLITLVLQKEMFLYISLPTPRDLHQTFSRNEYWGLYHDGSPYI